MPEIKIVYLAGYGMERNTGRNNATRDKVGALTKFLGPENVGFFSLPVNRFGWLNYFWFDLKMLLKLSAIARETVIIQRQAFLPLTNTLLWLRSMLVITEMHGTIRGELKFLDKTWIEKALIFILDLSERYNYRLCSAFIFNHPYLRPPDHSKPYTWTYSGANTIDFRVKDKLECRQRLQLPEHASVFLFSGMVSEWHGADLLVALFKRKEMFGYTLLIVGVRDNRYCRSLKKNASSNIIFVDFKDQHTVVDYINAADVCLLPVKPIRKSPGSPLKLYDYIACGKPVVAQQQTPGYSDEVLMHSLGIVTNFGDPAVASKSLTDFIEQMDSNFYHFNNRQLALGELGWNNRIIKWIDFISLLQNKKVTH